MLKSLPQNKWDWRCAGHLLNRAGFGGSPETISQLERLGPEKAVESLLEGSDPAGLPGKPPEVEYTDRRLERQQMEALSEPERLARRKEMMRAERQSMIALVGWWLQRMRHSQWVLREKLTLFWHGHFASGAPKVRETYLLWQQNQTLRANALGNFRTLAKAISRDPAMMVYLDTLRSRVDAPNENFAREFFELFTLGIGNYSEDDIRQAARAFTGYRIDPANGAFQFVQKQHDPGPKTIFGKTEKFSGDDVVELATSKPQCARFIGAKLWEFFAYEDPDRALVDAIAAEFLRGNYEIKPLMRKLLMSEEFYSPKSMGTQIKSPVQWLVQSTNVLEVELPPALAVFNCLRQLGQMPFAPPNVKGWDGGKAWINTSTLLARYNFSRFLAGTLKLAPERGRGPLHNWQGLAGGDLQRLAPDSLRADPQKLLESLTKRLFQQPLPERDHQQFETYLVSRSPATDGMVRELLHLMMSTPNYQLT